MPKIEHNDGHIRIGGFGFEINLRAKKEIEAIGVIEPVRSILEGIAKACIEKGAVAIGHIKSYLRSDAGYIKADTIGIRHGIFIENKMCGEFGEGTFTINAIVIGLRTEDISEIAMKITMDTFQKYGFDAVIIQQSMNEAGHHHNGE